MSCRGCINWQCHYPNDGGVCWSNGQPGFKGAATSSGTAQGRAAIGDTLVDIVGPNMPVTRFDSTCDNEKAK